MCGIKRLIVTVLTALLCLAAPRARASDPWPGEAVPPPPDLNIILYYNAFAAAGSYGQPDGTVTGQHTRVSVDVQALRYIHTFNVQGALAGVQLYVPYVSFLGNQQADISAPAGAPQPAALNHAGGFGQPSFGAFLFPYHNQRTGTGLVLESWVSPPIGGHNGDASLNNSQNLWTGELEAGFHATLAGQPEGRNLALEVWGETYFHGGNGDAGLVAQAVNANTLPPGRSVNPEPAGSPAVRQDTLPAQFSMQPTEELRVYLPYQFSSGTRTTIAPGFYQSFGGKGIYTLPDGTKLDSGTRTDETQLRLILSTYLSSRWQVAINSEYDVIAHGGPLYRTIELRIGRTF